LNTAGQLSGAQSFIFDFADTLAPDLDLPDKKSMVTRSGSQAFPR
jgi:hypothetical protein